MTHATVNQPDGTSSGGNGGQPIDASQPVEITGEGRPFGLFSRVGGQLPTLLVMALLGGIGVYGHQSGWKLPKFSALSGRGMAEREDWCEEHGVPESLCVECHPDLLPRGKDFGWCKEHGIANCPLCHPEVAQLRQTPVVSEADRQRATRTLAAAPRPENNAICKNYRRRIQFASQEALKKAGVDVALVDRQSITESIAASGQITYDQTRFASLSSRLPGTVWHVEKNAGDQVRAGEVLALVDAAEVGRAKMELIQALAEEELRGKYAARMGPASAQGTVPERQLETAQAELVHAQARLLGAQQTLVNLGFPLKIEVLRGLPEGKLARQLQFFGLPAVVVERFNPAETTSNLLPLKAPLDGIVVTRHAVAGEVVDASRVLFQLADTCRMWLTLSVPLEQAGKLALGQSVRFRPDGSQGEVSGTLVWRSTTADPQTRMVTVRAELPNPSGQLFNETFGAGWIILREEKEAITVPNEAVHGEGCCHVVFVRDKGYFDSKDSPKVFHVRTVRLGARAGRLTEIVAGVLPGEVVATKGSDVLRAELLKNNLGEGCCGGK